MKRIMTYLILSAILTVSCGTSPHADYVFQAPEVIDPIPSSLPFSRGVNFSEWFEASAPRTIPFGKYTEQDFKNVKSMGADVIRLPIKLHNMTSGAPDYILDPLFLQFLDQAVTWAEQQQIYIIIDNHSFDPVAATDPGIGSILVPVWTQLAQRYKDRSEYVLYEILNEPHGIDAGVWGEIQGSVVAAIRAIDEQRYIIVGGVGYNSIDDLFNLPAYTEDNIIYTFHFYDPYFFTHQGETWGAPPNLRKLKGMPFPADVRKLPRLPSELWGTWIESNIRATYRQEATVQAMARRLDRALQFSQERGNLPLFCGEFGVYIPNSLNEDRVRWYQTTTALLDQRGIARTSWDYFGGFGVFATGRGGSFESDLNVDIVNAMGFTAPPQKPAEKARTAFTVFDNYPAPLIDLEYYGCDVDYYYQNGEKNAISWGNARQHGAFFFNFRGGVDWEYLQSAGYTLTFTAKAEKSADFEARFTNREDDSTTPWRMVAPIAIAADGQWHTIRIPLSSMREQGAWVNASEKWLNPEGKFEWNNTNSLAFVAESHALQGITVLFDTVTIEAPLEE